MASRAVSCVANGLVAPGASARPPTFTRKAAGELGERIGQRLERFAERLSDAAERGVLLPQEADRADELLETLADGLALPESSTYDSSAGIVQEFGRARRRLLEPGSHRRRLAGVARRTGARWRLE